MAAISRSIEIRLSQISFDALPADVLAHLSDEERRAVIEGGSYFRSLAKRTKRKDLKRLFGAVEKDQPVTLRMSSEGDGPYLNYFGFTLMKIGGVHPQLRLASPLPNLPFPKLIREIYEVVGGFREPWADYAGLVATPAIRSYEEIGYWLSEENKIDGTKAFCFYQDGGGDSFGFDSEGRGVQYNHEEGILELAGLEETFGDYFDWALKRA